MNRAEVSASPDLDGPAGRLETLFDLPRDTDVRGAAVVCHPHPQHGGTMHYKVAHTLARAFARLGLAALRFNFRGVGRSQGLFDNGPGELSDAATALDWMQGYNPDSKFCWIAGVSFGSWISMQLLMRRPEIAGFISVAPPANLYDFSFLAPCPSSGLMINGAEDRVVSTEAVAGLVERLKTQKGVIIDHQVVPKANHFFENEVDELMTNIDAYLDDRLSTREDSAA